MNAQRLCYRCHGHASITKIGDGFNLAERWLPGGHDLTPSLHRTQHLAGRQPFAVSAAAISRSTSLPRSCIAHTSFRKSRGGAAPVRLRRRVDRCRCRNPSDGTDRSARNRDAGNPFTAFVDGAQDDGPLHLTPVLAKSNYRRWPETADGVVRPEVGIW
jgi:hypothetical protein